MILRRKSKNQSQIQVEDFFLEITMIFGKREI